MGLLTRSSLPSEMGKNSICFSSFPRVSLEQAWVPHNSLKRINTKILSVANVEKYKQNILFLQVQEPQQQQKHTKKSFIKSVFPENHRENYFQYSELFRLSSFSTWLESRGRREEHRGTLSYILAQRRSARNGGKKTRCILVKNRDFLPKLESLPYFARSRLAPLRKQLTIQEKTERTREILS